ncbi:hypothetical protein U1Q18_012912, partial [Sarracenia purpurea var. burkii]
MQLCLGWRTATAAFLTAAKHGTSKNRMRATDVFAQIGATISYGVAWLCVKAIGSREITFGLYHPIKIQHMATIRKLIIASFG